MTPDEYKDAKAKSGISVLDIWCDVTGISRDRDKSFSSGRTAIPSDAASKVNALIERLVEGAGELQAMLQKELPDCSVRLDEDCLAIDIAFPSGYVVRLHNSGVDLMNFWQVYKTEATFQGTALFLRGALSPHQSANTRKLQWYLWRGDFVENRNLGRFQNYANPVKRVLLDEVFKRHI